MVVLWVGKRRCPAACSAECTNGSVVGGQEEMSCCMLC